MKIIGFNINNLQAKKNQEIKKTNVNTNIQFTNVEKEKIEFIKGEDTLKISFRFDVTYSSEEKEKKSKLGEIVIEGTILLSLSNEESKKFIDSWKKKEIPIERATFLYNFILRKCSAKAIQFEEEVSLPLHLPIPQISPKNN